MGRTLSGRYELLEKIGDGGMAVVYKGRDRLLNRFVAVKILKPEYTKDVKFIDSFRRESQSAASLSHPNIVNVYDVGREGNIHYIVMELVNGKVLSDVIREEGPLRPRAAVEVAKQIALALGSAHKNSIIHRDVKPHNILLMEDGTAKITDFGIARAVNSATVMGGGTGTIMGSVHYFSPEQARGAYVDEKSDIYSLGIVLYEMLTGQVPFDGENPVSVAIQHINEEITPPTQIDPTIPKDLEDIILKATQKYQNNRFKSAEEMYEALDKARLSDFLTYGREQSGPSEDKGLGATQMMAMVNSGKEIPGVNGLVQAAGGESSAPAETPGESGKAENPEQPLPGGEGTSEGPEGAASASAGPEAEGESPKRERINRRNNPPKDRKKPAVIALAAVCGLLLAILLTALFSSLGGGTGGDRNRKEGLEVPPVWGYTQEEALSVLEAMGLTMKVDGEINSVEYEAGLIAAQTPSAGMRVKAGNVVTVKISKGATAITVPDVTGKTKEDAMLVLRTYEYAVGQIYEEYNTEVKEGLVIRQTPLGGNEAEKGTPVDIYVSKGEEIKTIAVPSLKGKTEAEADAILKEAGLVLGTPAYTSSNEVPEGQIISQTVAAGSEAQPGSSVDITVSTGPELTGPVDIPITIDYSKAATDVFQLTVVVSDSTGVGTVIDHEQRLKEDESETITISGQGTGSITVIFDGEVVMNQSINFNTGEIN